MAAGADHVFTEIAELLSADAPIRIRAIHEERWVAYPRAKIILEKLERLFDYPRRSRMPCLLLVGRPGMGKTMLLERFCRQHESCWEAERGREPRLFNAAGRPELSPPCNTSFAKCIDRSF
jgi:hypothetical protein